MGISFRLQNLLPATDDSCAKKTSDRRREFLVKHVPSPFKLKTLLATRSMKRNFPKTVFKPFQGTCEELVPHDFFPYGKPSPHAVYISHSGMEIVTFPKTNKNIMGVFCASITCRARTGSGESCHKHDVLQIYGRNQAFTCTVMRASWWHHVDPFWSSEIPPFKQAV